MKALSGLHPTLLNMTSSTGNNLSLLGKVVVVESLDAGIRMARKFGYGFRIVSLDGDILSTTGSISGGSKEKRESGILSRNRESPNLGKALQGLRKTMKQ